MPLFCKICANLLTVVTTNDEFYFKCVKCQQTYTPDDNDTLRYEDVKGTNLIIYKTVLQNAGQDPVNPKVYINCIECKNNIVKQVRLGDDMRLINICTNCNVQWIEGIDQASELNNELNDAQKIKSQA